MREIKFKAKRVDNGEWVFGHYYEAEGNSFICGDTFYDGVNTSWNHMVDPETVCPYINSEDGYGNEIYEGDILTAPSAMECEVFWFQEEMRWAMRNKELGMFNINAGLHRVTGNIHDK